MSVETIEEAAALCPQCQGPMPPPKLGRGRPAKFCSDACRKASHRLASAARDARTRMPQLRRYLDDALTDVERAARRLHASGLDPDELMLRPGVRTDLPGDIDYSLRTSLERLRYAAREHRDAVEAVKRDPAAPAAREDEE